MHQKDQYLQKINSNSEDLKPTAVEIVVYSTLLDYFPSRNQVAKLIYSPSVMDMALVLDRKYVKDVHLKGYLKIKLISQN